MSWFKIENSGELDSPSLVLYEEHLQHNLQKMLELVKGDASRLMPHIKTNKMPEVVRQMTSMGIKRFKASTIPEAEIAAGAGAEKVLLAHQLVGPKTKRFLKLISCFPGTTFSTIIDNPLSLEDLDRAASQENLKVNVYIDVNNGMNRSGMEPGKDLEALIDKIPSHRNISFKGLHVYDGHLRDPEFQERKQKIEEGLAETNLLFEKLKQQDPSLELITGGTPSFTVHLLESTRICSPGTCVFWDWGYGEKLAEQPFKYAVLLFCRIISKPTQGIITVDLGHKAVAAENPIDKRLRFLNLPEYELLSQSEEHGVVKVKNWDRLKVGDELYAVPYHICPTVNLYDEIYLIRNQRLEEVWEIPARKRRISI